MMTLALDEYKVVKGNEGYIVACNYDMKRVYDADEADEKIAHLIDVAGNNARGYRNARRALWQSRVRNAEIMMNHLSFLVECFRDSNITAEAAIYNSKLNNWKWVHDACLKKYETLCKEKGNAV